MLKVLFLSSLVLSSLAAAPPPVPSAGVIERELEKEYEGKPLTQDKQIPDIQIDIPKEKLEIPSDIQVFIAQVEIQGNESISCDEILSWIGESMHCDLSLQDIYAMCESIDAAYAKQGYFLARAYPPPQTIEEGKLVIRIIEGKLGNISVVGNQRYSTKFIRSYFTPLENRSLQYDKFLRRLLLLNENSDLTAGAVFEKGEEFGTADVIIRVDDSRPLHLYLNGNNYGRKLTTNARVGGRLDAGNLVTYGDMLSIAEVVGFPVKALYFTDVVYTFPINSNGTFLEGAFLFSKFHVEELTSLHLKGQSLIATLKGTHAIGRWKQLSIDLFSYFDYKQIKNITLGQVTSFDKLRVLTVGTLIDHFSPNGGRDYLTIRAAAGIPNFLGGLSSVSNSCSRPGAGGRFVKFNADYDRLQKLPKDCFFHFHGSGQWSPYKLTVPEQIYIGGDDTVRGFPLATALGDSGYYLNFELFIPTPFLADKRFFMAKKKKWKDVLQWVGFLDHGGVFLQSEQDTFQWGSGVGVRVNGPWKLNLSLDVGFPLNHRHLATQGAILYIKVTGQPF